MSKKKLLPLDWVDPLDGDSQSTQITDKKCSHPQDSLSVQSHERVMCKSCGNVWTGPGVTQLVEQFK